MFLRNIGMFGTPSTVITVVAASWASCAVSGKVPALAWMSIIGMAVSPWIQVVRRSATAGPLLTHDDLDESTA
jgi:hypothetical protein